MAFLAPLAAGASAAAPALAASTAAAGAGAAGAAAAGGAALGTGLSAGTILGTGAASSGILGGLGLNALGGMTSILPATAAAGAPALVAPALASKGLVAAATPGIFSSAAPALGGLKSLATPGLLQTAGMSPLGGMASMLPAGASMPGAAGLQSLAMANAPLTAGANPATWNAINQAAGLGNLPAQAGNLGAQFTKVADVAAKTTIDPTKGLLGNAAKITASPTMQPTPGLAESIRNVNTALRGPVDMSYAANAQGLSPNAAALQQTAASAVDPSKGFLSNAMSLAKNPSLQGAMDYIETHPYASAGAAYGLYNMMQPKYEPPPVDKGSIRPYEYNISQRPEAYEAAPGDSSERRYFNAEFVEKPAYAAKEGGLMSLAVGGPVEQMAQQNFAGANTGYPMSQINSPLYSNSTVQRPEAVNTMLPSGDAKVGAFSGEQRFYGGGQINTGTSTAQPANSSGYNYSFNPATNEFTQLTGPSSVQSAAPQYESGSGWTPHWIASDPLAKKVTPSTNVPPGYNPVPGRPGEYWTSGPYGSKVYHTFPVSNTATSPTKPEVTGGIAGSGVAGGGAGSVRPPMQNMQSYYNEPPAPAYQSPAQRLGLTDFYAMMDEQLKQMGGYAAGGGISSLRGQSHLGDYSDGGRLLKGPGDGVSDSIPAVIGERQPARLADGEFVVPARIVSEIGNGSTDAGARKLYAMMDRVQKARRKTVGKGKIAANTRADKHLPA